MNNLNVLINVMWFLIGLCIIAVILINVFS